MVGHCRAHGADRWRFRQFLGAGRGRRPLLRRARHSGRLYRNLAAVVWPVVHAAGDVQA